MVFNLFQALTIWVDSVKAETLKSSASGFIKPLIKFASDSVMLNSQLGL
jgi:hypothetical protein